MLIAGDCSALNSSPGGVALISFSSINVNSWCLIVPSARAGRHAIPKTPLATTYCSLRASRGANCRRAGGRWLNVLRANMPPSIAYDVDGTNWKLSIADNRTGVHRAAERSSSR